MIDRVEKRFVVWLCPLCGRTVQCEDPSTYIPNLTCYHGDSVGFMVRVWPPVISEEMKDEKK